MRDEAGTAGCPSFLALARWEASPGGETGDHVAGCARCTARVDELRADRTALLGSDPHESSRRAARQILASFNTRSARSRWAEVWRRRVGFALPAFAALALFVVLGQRSSLIGASLSDAGQEPAVRAKGALWFEMYRLRAPSGVVEIARDGDEYRGGDRLRFEYSTAAPGYLFVVGVDDEGAVFPYYPDDGSAGLPVKTSTRAMLSDSIELDGHQGFERIFALWSPRPITLAAVRAATAQALTTAGGDLRRVDQLPLDVDQATRLLRRP
ncbi:MAG TPA: hypothetical protein VGG33_23000 [Polyangia bacterium]